MKTRSLWVAPLLALPILTGACSDKETPRTPNPSQATSPSSTQPPECDMTGMDMSKMSAEEHQKMLDDCEKAKARLR